ncbi:MAG: tyrosine-type recombinase/integrase [Planctomycetota bacterium]
MFRINLWADWSNAFGDECSFGCLAESAKVYRKQARWLINELCLRDFDPATPKVARATLLDMLRDWASTRAKSTVRNRLSRLRKFFKFVNSELPDTIPPTLFDALSMPKGAVNAALPTALSEGNALRVLKFARTLSCPSWPDMHMYTYICLGMMMGLRPAELVHLHWSEIDLSAPTPVLGLRELPTRRLKNDLAGQRITMPPELAYLLREYFEVNSVGPLFPASNVYALSKLRAVSGIKNLNAHILRRTAITNWFLSGIDLKLLTILSRHSNPVILYKHYLARPEIADIYTGLPLMQ